MAATSIGGMRRRGLIWGFGCSMPGAARPRNFRSLGRLRKFGWSQTKNTRGTPSGAFVLGKSWCQSKRNRRAHVCRPLAGKSASEAGHTRTKRWCILRTSDPGRRKPAVRWAFRSVVSELLLSDATRLLSSKGRDRGRSLRAKIEKVRDAPIQWSGVEHFADLVGQGVGKKRLLQQCPRLRQDAMMHDGVVGVAREKQDTQIAVMGAQ